MSLSESIMLENKFGLIKMNKNSFLFQKNIFDDYL